MFKFLRTLLFTFILKAMHLLNGCYVKLNRIFIKWF